ncbi:MAG: diguanylate cyclase [Thermodesulfobacteriota bacterium]
MSETILVITEKSSDLQLFEEMLAPKGFHIEQFTLFHKIEDILKKDPYAAIIADYDLIGETADAWSGILQEKKSRACFILYGGTTDLDSIAGLLQKGAYGFIPRSQLSERLYDTIMGGLENRKTFIEILEMIDEMKDVNQRLNNEKETLKARNRELCFINRLSSEVAYDLNWDKILPRILDAGLLKVINLELIGLLYRIGPRWNISLYADKQGIKEDAIQRFREDASDRFFSLCQERISPCDIHMHLYPPHAALTAPHLLASKSIICELLSISGKPLGMLFIVPKKPKETDKETEKLASTIANILAMSLKNAQEYQLLKERTLTDGLTGIYNHTGLKDFLRREFKRARRHVKPLSLIMIDVDNFKLINDSLGHLAGDHILRELAACLNKAVRGTDIVARYGGDEFVLLLPETELDKASMLMERIARTLENHSFMWGGRAVDVEVSYGISSLEELGRNEKEQALVRLADTRLYTSKKSKQNAGCMGEKRAVLS